jgi:hypothetical protein
MAERTHIPSSPACGAVGDILADALDGLLKPEDEATVCRIWPPARPARPCLKKRGKAASGWSFSRRSQRFRPGLLEKILARTGPGQAAGLGGHTACGVRDMPYGPIPPAWQRRDLHGLRSPLCRAATAHDRGDGVLFDRADAEYDRGSLEWPAGLADLRPTAVRSFMERRLTTASVPIIRYYDHLRFVYEVESVKEMARRNPTRRNP